MTIATRIPHAGCPALADLTIRWPDGSFSTAVGISKAQERFLALLDPQEARDVLASEYGVDIAWPKGT